MKEQPQTREETETPSEDEDEEVEEVTHATSYGRCAASRVADHLAALDAEEHRLKERDGRVSAHASVVDGWTEHHDDRPDDVRREVWIDPFHVPPNPTEIEQRFIKTRKIRQRVLEWTGDLS